MFALHVLASARTKYIQLNINRRFLLLYYVNRVHYLYTSLILVGPTIHVYARVVNAEPPMFMFELTSA